MRWNVFKRPDSVDILRETLELVVKAGRRCTHDLAHAVDCISDKTEQQMFQERVAVWHAVFYQDGGPKDYRHRLHQDISRLECEVKRLKRRCTQHGINPDDELPF